MTAQRKIYKKPLNIFTLITSLALALADLQSFAAGLVTDNPMILGAASGLLLDQTFNTSKGGFGEAYWGRAFRIGEDLDKAYLLLNANTLRAGHDNINNNKVTLEMETMGIGVKTSFKQAIFAISFYGGRLSAHDKESKKNRFYCYSFKINSGITIFQTDLHSFQFIAGYHQIHPRSNWSDLYSEKKIEKLSLGLGLELFQIND